MIVWSMYAIILQSQILFQNHKFFKINIQLIFVSMLDCVLNIQVYTSDSMIFRS